MSLEVAKFIQDKHFHPMVLKAIALAEEGHRGQTRKFGQKKPYITHPLEVMKLAEIEYQRYLANRTPVERTIIPIPLELIQIAALFHDLPEDVEKWKDQEEALVNELFVSYGGTSNPFIGYRNYLIDALTRLNKSHWTGYLNFVLAAKENIISHLVKIADVTHNGSDNAPRGMNDRYSMALWILRH